MTETVLTTIAPIVLFVMVVLLIPCSYRIWRGPEPADRLLAVDLFTTLLMGIILLTGIVNDIPILIDISIALAAFSFIGTIGVARYISEGRVF